MGMLGEVEVVSLGSFSWQHDCKGIHAERQSPGEGVHSRALQWGRGRGQNNTSRDRTLS